MWSYEKGDSGTVHYQGYMQLVNKCKFQALKNKVRPFEFWVAPAGGNVKQSQEYISHTGKHANKKGLLAGPWSFGTSTTSGERTDMQGLTEAILAGKTMKQLARTHTSMLVKHFSNTQKTIQLLNDKKRTWMTELYIFTGIPGSGKSHRAHEEGQQWLNDNGYGDQTPYDVMLPAKKGDPVWWQDYEGQAVVIIDDFYGTGISCDGMKTLIDKYSAKVNLKNGHCEFLARRVYITSNTGWTNWWPESLLSNESNKEAILRRITEVVLFTEKYDDHKPVRSNATAGNMLVVDTEDDDVEFIKRINAAYNPAPIVFPDNDLRCHERLNDGADEECDSGHFAEWDNMLNL